MMTYAERKRAADAFETRVQTALTLRGWTCEPFGQGQLAESIRNLLRDVQTPVRWMPDLIAVKRLQSTAVARFVDAKAGELWRETGNHDIELAAVESAAAWSQFAMCPLDFVFTDGGVLTPTAVLETARPGPWRGNGSGTRFVLVARSVCRKFDDVFGHPLPATAGAPH